MNKQKLSPVFRPPCTVMLLVFAIAVFVPNSSLYASEDPKELTVGGTGTALATMRMIGKQFHAKHPDITVTVPPSLGSSGGIKALVGGELDITISYKDISDDEKNQGLQAVEYAKCPLVFVTHRTNVVSNVTLQEVVDLYTGKITKWADDTPVRLILRPAGEATTKIMEEMSEDMKKAVQNSLTRKGLNIAINDQENADLLERLPGSFGASTLCQVISEKRTLNVLHLNGIKPSVRTLSDSTYPYFKALYMITGPKSSPLSRQFIDFVFSPSVQAILSNTGHLLSR